MHIHFVCSGNCYRSRLAEAYCKSKMQNQAIMIDSSGIVAQSHAMKNGPICWYAMRLIKKNALTPYMSWRERQSTKAILKNVDLLICMQQLHLDYCQKELGYDRAFEVWNIPDLDELYNPILASTLEIHKDIEEIQLTQETYRVITKKVDELLVRII